MNTFTINLEKVKNNYETLKKALPDALIAYAIKANYDKKILQTLSQLDCIAEACSTYEQKIAEKTGFKKIIRNGYEPNGKTWLTNVELINDREHVKGLIGARLNTDPKSKLGMSEQEILKHKWDAISIHTRENFNQALNKAEELASKTGARYVDAGGGFAQDRIDSLKKTKHELIIEPGRYLVANACQIITKVLAIKQDKIIIDTGMNLLNKFSDSRYTIKSMKEGPKKPYKVYGPIPTDIDTIGTHNLPITKKGDTLIIENAGAYTLSMLSNWVLGKPKIKYI